MSGGTNNGGSAVKTESGSNETLIVGIATQNDTDNAHTLLAAARNDGYDFVVTTLPTDIHTTTRSDVLSVDSRWWRTSVVGKLEVTSNSLEKMSESLQWAWHMHLPAVILPPAVLLNPEWVVTQAVTAKNNGGQLWVPVELTVESIQQWQKISVNNNSAVGIVLNFPDDHDSIGSSNSNSINNNKTQTADYLQLLHILIGQPLHGVKIRTSQFLINKLKFPTLTKLHQTLLSLLLQRLGHHLRFLIEQDTIPTTDESGKTTYKPYWQYLQHWRNRSVITTILDSDESKAERDYLDCLQRPLQPLRDHLEFATYETFERDPVKYEQYEKAIVLALRDQIKARPSCTIVIMVVGAGRGPLVTCVLNACQTLDPPFVNIKLFAVEKNPSAMVYLRSKLKYDQLWSLAGKSVIKLVHSDLRHLKRDKHLYGMQADIVVSELLGSFGDNELSPECLDPLYNDTDVCRPGMISIPTSYTSYLAPVTSTHLYQQVELQAYMTQESGNGIVGRQQAFETPYVVRPYRASQMHKEVECWSFFHPNPNQTGIRQMSVDFEHFSSSVCNGSGYNGTDATLINSLSTVDCAWTLHGFIGTFYSVLYNDVTISTAPSHSFSTGMFSWFPLYFPLEQSMTVPPNTSIRANLWRKIDSTQRRVWYEWSASISPTDGKGKDKYITQQTPIYNLQGRSYNVSML